MKNNENRAEWASKLGFILAAAGSAVGLGNIWKFPGKAYENGGGAFLLIYLLIVLAIGVPVMVTELSLGRFTKKNTIGIFRQLDKRFTWVGWAGVVCAAIILAYYGHVGGWVCDYIATYAVSNVAMEQKLPYFYALLGYGAETGATWFPWQAIIFAAFFMGLNAIILIKGVTEGIEKFNKIGMPALFVILIILLIRSVTLPGAGEGLAYMFSFDFSKLSGQSVLVALGQAFFSLSLGMAIMTTYGSYLSKKESIPKNSLIICGLDTLVAFLAGFIIVPAVFATLGPDAIGKGGSFAFGPLGGVFEAMPAGRVFGFLFYVLLFFAAMSSSISIAEGVVAFISEEFNVDRKKTIIWLTVICFAVGVIYTISQAAYSIKLPWLDFTGITYPAAADWMEMLTDRLLLPLCAFGECLFVGWIWKPQNVIAECEAEGNAFTWKKAYAFLVKYICPLAILGIIVYGFATGTTIS